MEGILQETEHPKTSVGLPAFPINHAHTGKLRRLAAQLRFPNHVNAQLRLLSVKISVERTRSIPIKLWDGVGMRLAFRDLRFVGSKNHSQLIGICFRLRGEALADLFDVPRGCQKPVGLIEESVLPIVEVLVRGGAGIEMVGDVVEWNSSFVVGGI